MSRRTTILSATLTVALVLSIAAGTAGALRSLSFTPAGAIRATSGTITFTGGGNEFKSAVTLNGTINRAIPKRKGAVFGTITRAESGPCTPITSPEARCTLKPGPLERAPPWNIFYSSILGSLPIVTDILVMVERVTFLLELMFSPIIINCLITGEFGARAAVDRRGAFNLLTILRGALINAVVRELEPATGLCPRADAIELRGSFDLAPTQTVRLI